MYDHLCNGPYMIIYGSYMIIYGPYMITPCPYISIYNRGPISQVLGSKPRIPQRVPGAKNGFLTLLLSEAHSSCPGRLQRMVLGHFWDHFWKVFWASGGGSRSRCKSSRHEDLLVPKCIAWNHQKQANR